VAAQLLTRELLVHWRDTIGIGLTGEAVALFFVGSLEVLESPVAHVKVVCLPIDSTACLVFDVDWIVRFIYLYSSIRIFPTMIWYHSLARVNITTGRCK